MATILFAQWLSAQFFKNLGHAVFKNLGKTRPPSSRHTISEHSSSVTPVKVLASPLGAMVLYCYHTATYYPANFDRVDQDSTLFYSRSVECLHGIVSPYIIRVTVIILIGSCYRC